MKKILLLLVLFSLYSLGSHSAFADSTPAPTATPATTPAPAATTPATPPTATPAATTPITGDGTVQPNGACSNDDNCDDPGGQNYGCYKSSQTAATGICTPNGNPPGSGTTPGSPAASTNSGAANFVPLTNFPVFAQGLTTAPTLPNFFNQLYKYCVGIAAVLAVLQIMRAGVMYMGGDSVTETKEARALIASSLLGLVLVLSPVIVFGIINQKILNLDLSSDFAWLNSNSSATASTPAATPAPANCPTTLGNGAMIPAGCPTTICTNQPGYQVQTYGGTKPQYECVQPGNSCPAFAAGSQNPISSYLTNANVTAASITACCTAQASPKCSVSTVSFGSKGSQQYCNCGS